MRNCWLTRLLCLVAVMGLMASLGCNAFTAERQRRRALSIQKDLDHMVDDVDWALGLDEPSTLQEESFPPYPR